MRVERVLDGRPAEAAGPRRSPRRSRPRASSLLAALVGDDEIVLARAADAAEGEAPPSRRSRALRTRGGEKVTPRAPRPHRRSWPAPRPGQLYCWELARAASRLTDVVAGGEAPLTALEFGLGGNSRGRRRPRRARLSGWFRARASPDGDLAPGAGARLRAAGRRDPVASAPRRASAASSTGGADGSLVLRHLDLGAHAARASRARASPADALLVTPRGRRHPASSARTVVDATRVDNPHPEVTLAGAVRQGLVRGLRRAGVRLAVDRRHRRLRAQAQPRPAHRSARSRARSTRCSSPIPLAVFGAIYTSQFMHPRSRRMVKPTVEIMAALPSVVLGFLAGLWLAPRVETDLVPRAADARAPAAARHLPAALLWERAARGRARGACRPGTEVALSSCRCCCSAAAWPAGARALGRGAGSSAATSRPGCSATPGLAYDQRNSIVVGFAMGFAVIPIIFTIAEDALLERAAAPDRGLARPRREPLADGDARRAADREPGHLLRDHGRLRPRRRRDDDRADGHRQHADPRLDRLQRHAHPVGEHRGRDPRGAVRRHALPRAVPVRRAAVPRSPSSSTRSPSWCASACASKYKAV